ncbi:MAG: AAA family ATPase [Candidatus Delongbacteria bacterium]|nr:AAA family ATPase [Candidatus Delongbacteria bacterium]MBN2834633.1 AAA family ATPase [Candidatus Delongbacteria bacterium]
MESLFNLVPDFVLGKFSQNNFEGSVKAYTVFVDISGFTSLTQELVKFKKLGIETLTEIVTSIYKPVIDLIYKYDGFISTFAGDAFTAIFPNDLEAEKILYCVKQISDTSSQNSEVKTIAGNFHVSIKVGVSYGDVNWKISGNDEIKYYYFRGFGIDGCPNCEKFCNTQEIVFDINVLSTINNNSVDYVQLSENYFKLLNCRYSQNDQINKDKNINNFNLISKFIPSFYDIIKLKPEFKHIVSVFISINDIDPNLTEKIINTISELTVLYKCFLESVDFGDKGAKVVALFSIPTSFENDLDRALEFALRIKELFRYNIRIGISEGVVYSGIIGSPVRSYYGAMGLVISISARLAMKAIFGTIISSASISENPKFLFKYVGDYNYKGINKSIQTYELDKRGSSNKNPLKKMIGRDKELKLLSDCFNKTMDAKTQVVYIIAKAGMGKSLLIQNFDNYLLEKDKYNIFYVYCDTIIKSTLHPFKNFIKNYFAKNSETYSTDEFDNDFNEIIKNYEDKNRNRNKIDKNEIELSRVFLAASLGFFYENSVYNSLDAKGRFENTLYAFKTFFKIFASIKPIVIVIEDYHIIDNESNNLLKMITRNISDFPILTIITCRYKDDGSKPEIISNDDIESNIIELQGLDDEESNNLLQSIFDNRASKQLKDFIIKKSDYNPFYIEQYAKYVKEESLIYMKDDLYSLKDKPQEIPDSINKVLIARIDRLSIDLKKIVQVASVCGNEVEVAILSNILGELDNLLERSDLSSYFTDLELEDILYKFDDLKYLFRHSLLQESAYDMQLRSRLKKLHNLAGFAIERVYEKIDLKLDLLVYHFEKAENEEKFIHYLEKAAKWHQNNYHNEKAIEYFEKLIEYKIKLKNEDASEFLRLQGIIYEHIGNWNKALELYRKGLENADKFNNLVESYKAKYQIGSVYIKTDEKEEAKKYLEISKNEAEKNNDLRQYVNSCSRIAEIRYVESDFLKALDLFHEIERVSISNKFYVELVRIYFHIELINKDLGKIDKAILYNNKESSLCKKLKLKKEYLISLSNKIGILQWQRNLSEKDALIYKNLIQLSRETGDKFLEGDALEKLSGLYNSIGKVDKAIMCLTKAKNIFKEIDNEHYLHRVINREGNIHLKAGNFQNAFNNFEKYANYCKEQNMLVGYIKGLVQMGVTCIRAENYENSLKLFNKANEINNNGVNHKILEVWIRNNIGYLIYIFGDCMKSSQILEENLIIAEKIKFKYEFATCYAKLGEIYLFAGNIEKIEHYYKKSSEIFFEIEEYDKIISNNYYLAYGLYLNSKDIEAKEFIDDLLLKIDNVYNLDLKYKIRILDHCLNKNIEGLNNMLLEKDVKGRIRGLINFELWSLTKEEKYRVDALNIYENLHNKTKSIIYKIYMDKLNGKKN